MYNLIKSAEIISSNLVYSEIINHFKELYNPQDALLLVPTHDTSGDLEVVEVVGRLPNSLRYSAKDLDLNNLSEQLRNKLPAQNDLAHYHNCINISNGQGDKLAYLLYTLTDPELVKLVNTDEFIPQITSLLIIKHAIDSLPDLIKTQSKLKYQLSFFSSTINNIFEPYGIEMLIQLYMEIISEMFLLPSAITLISDGERYCPLYAKGINVKDCSEFAIDVSPFENNRQLATYPHLVVELTPDIIGEQNYARLIEKGAYLISPITWEDTSYLIICLAGSDYKFDKSDKVSLMALNNTINHAIQFNSTKANLMQNNNALDKRIFQLTSIYQASQFIFSENELDKTLAVSLDMLMEIFQSETSAVILKNPLEDTFKLKRVKSVNNIENMHYTFVKTAEAKSASPIIVDYTNHKDKEVFLQVFPEMSQLEDKLQPVIIAHLRSDDHYYGFISLSNRVTGEVYSDDDKELLTLLLASICIAIENSLILNEINIKNELLNKSLQNLYAIQEVLNTIRAANNIEQFGKLLLEVLDLGLGIKTASVIGKNNSDYFILYSYGDFDYTAILAQLPAISQGAVYNLSKDGNLCPILVFPILKQSLTQGYLIINEFADSTIDDADKIQILNIISLIIGETFANLLEKDSTSKDGIINYPLLISRHIAIEIEQMSEMGLSPHIVRFRHPDPQKVLIACQEWSEGFILLPDVGIILSPLAEETIIKLLKEHTDKYQFLTFTNATTILSQLFN